VSRIKGPDGIYIGPFETVAQAEIFEARLTRLIAVEQAAGLGTDELVHADGAEVRIKMASAADAAEMVEALRGIVAEGVKLHEFARIAPELAQAAIDAQNDLNARVGHSEIVVDKSAKGELTATYKPPHRLYRRKVRPR